MEILSTFNLFNKKNNIHQKKQSNPHKITMKLLESKLFTNSSNTCRQKSPDRTNSFVFLNKQFDECFPVKTEENHKKNNKISISNSIVKGFLPALIDNKARNIMKNKEELIKKEKNIININNQTKMNIFIEENEVKLEKTLINAQNSSKIDKKLHKNDKKKLFSNAKYYKNNKNSEDNSHYNHSLSFPNLNSLLISRHLSCEKLEEKNKIMKNMKIMENLPKNQKLIKQSDDDKNNDKNEDSASNIVKSMILLKKKTKYRDEENSQNDVVVQISTRNIKI